MDIVIITPLYYILGREKLFHDTNAIHYLVKPWAEKHRIFVIDVYFETMRGITRYLSKQERQYFRKGYYYDIENVSVALIEVQKKPKALPVLSNGQSEKVYDLADKWLEGNCVKPDMIISHIPSTTLRLMDKMPKDVYKIAVMHETDIRILKNRESIDKIETLYHCVFCRSKKIYHYFKSFNLNGLKSEIIYSGAPAGFKDKRRLHKPDFFHILYAGKLVPSKNVDIVIKSLALLPPNASYIFDIYGNGAAEKRLKRMVRKLRLSDKIKFHQFIPRNQLLEVMKCSDIFVMLSETETFGLVYLEAMSRGCITIGTEGEGIDGIILHKINGFLVESKNIEELKNTFEFIFNMNEQEYLNMQIEAVRTGQHYNENDMGNRYLKLVLSAKKN